MMEETAPRKPKGGRPKGDPNAIRIYRVNARLSASEHATLTAKADQIGMPPAQWLREAALSRRLPSPPVPAINREEYANLARLSANLNQLSKASNEGRAVTVNNTLLEQISIEVNQLRLALIGINNDS
jgi:hypothetical protein